MLSIGSHNLQSSGLCPKIGPSSSTALNLRRLYSALPLPPVSSANWPPTITNCLRQPSTCQQFHRLYKQLGQGRRIRHPCLLRPQYQYCYRHLHWMLQLTTPRSAPTPHTYAPQKRRHTHWFLPLHWGTGYEPKHARRHQKSPGQLSWPTTIPSRSHLCGGLWVGVGNLWPVSGPQFGPS